MKQPRPGIWIGAHRFGFHNSALMEIAYDIGVLLPVRNFHGMARFDVATGSEFAGPAERS
jgi:hypothetical protein